MDTISPALGVVIMMNNYFHDVATGLLVASGVSLYLLLKHYGQAESQETARYFMRSYETMRKVAKYSFWWIIIAGFPRTYFYKRFEWASDVRDLQVPAIIIKHAVVVAVLGTAIYLWHKYHGKVKAVRQSLEGTSSGDGQAG